MRHLLVYKVALLKYTFIVSKPLLVCMSAVIVEDLNNMLISLGYCLSVLYAIVKIIKENKK